MSSFRMSVDIRGIELTMDALVGDAAAAARPAAQAGAQVLYEQVKANVAGIRRKTGNLAASIYQAYNDKRSTAGGAQSYTVSWNTRKAPHALLVEYGHLQRYEVTRDPKTGRFITHRDRPLAAPIQIPAKPFLRPAISAMPRAEAAMRAEFLRRLNLAA